MTFVCPHCDAVTVFLCTDVRGEPECECGAIMEPAEDEALAEAPA